MKKRYFWNDLNVFTYVVIPTLSAFIIPLPLWLLISKDVYALVVIIWMFFNILFDVKYLPYDVPLMTYIYFKLI